jgi:rubrerythrin
MVARSVRPGGQGAEETPKVSAKEFAELAGCSPERVMRYYKAWDRAADDGLVPHFEALAPGQEVELPDADVWLGYYVSRNSATSERGTAIAEAAEAEGIRPTKALEVAENPTALRAAILADPSTARAARQALLDRVREDPDLQAELARDVVRTEELKKAVVGESRAADRIGYVRQIAESGQIKTPAGQTLDAPVELRQEAERHLSLIEELDDDEDTGEWATEAYDTMKSLVVETVETDPDLRVRERRTKFYNSLQRATKVFEELTFDDVQEFVEDDMVQRLEELQQAISTAITALRGAARSDSRPAE